MTAPGVGEARMAAWAYPDGRAQDLKVNAFNRTLGIRIQNWVLGVGASEDATLEVFEDDGDEAKNDLLGTWTGKIERIGDKDGFRFVSSGFQKATAGETVVKNAVRVRLIDPSAKKQPAAQPLDILGGPEEGEEKVFQLSFRIRVGAETAYTCQAVLKLFVDTDGCVLRIPLIGQTKYRPKKGKSTKTKAMWRGKERKAELYDVSTDTRTYDYATNEREWLSCTRKVPFLKTSDSTLSKGAWGAKGKDMLTVAQAIEKGATTKDKTLLNLNMWDHMMNPATLKGTKKVVETIQYGGCKLTSVAAAFWYLGLMPKVLEGIVSKDEDKDLFPHYCGESASKKVGKNNRRLCNKSDVSKADLCNGCTSNKVDSNVPSVGSGHQIPPLWFNVYLWWFILAHQDPQGYACHTDSATNDKVITDSKGNFSVFQLVEHFGDELDVSWEWSNKTFGERSSSKLKDEKNWDDDKNWKKTVKGEEVVIDVNDWLPSDDELETEERRVRLALRKGLPVYCSLRFKHHINLITGCRQLEDGSWQYLFWDPGGGGGWKVWSKLSRAWSISCFLPKNWSVDKAEWEIKPHDLQSVAAPTTGAAGGSAGTSQPVGANELAIHVVDHQGKPADGLQANLEPVGGGAPIQLVTDADGRLRHEAEASTWRVSFPTFRIDRIWNASQVFEQEHIEWITENDDGVFTLEVGTEHRLEVYDPDLQQVAEILGTNEMEWGAALQRRWFEGSAAEKDGEQKDHRAQRLAPADTKTIKMDELLSKFERAKETYDEIFPDKVASEAAQRSLFELLKRDGYVQRVREQSGPVSFDYIEVLQEAFAEEVTHEQELLEKAVCYQEHAHEGYLLSDAVRDFDDLDAALANFVFRLTAAGKIERSWAGFKVRIERVGVQVVDSFDFVGEQTLGLGRWNFKTGELGKTVVGAGWESIALENSHYRAWREKSKQLAKTRGTQARGGDFRVFSDVKVVPLPEPIEFTVDG